MGFTTEGSAALRHEAVVGNSMEELQAKFIFDSFLNATILMADSEINSASPIILKKRAITEAGTMEVVEIHGYYSKSVAEKAIYSLQDKGHLNAWSANALVEFYYTKSGLVKAIRFTRPLIRKTL